MTNNEKWLHVRPSLVRGYVKPGADGATLGLAPAVGSEGVRSSFLWRVSMTAPTSGEPWRMATPWGEVKGKDAEALMRALLKMANTEAVRLVSLPVGERPEPQEDQPLAAAVLLAARFADNKANR
ncbi:hypothetical protein WAA24_004338 [Stenotrophomonas maltophilia]